MTEALGGKVSEIQQSQQDRRAELIEKLITYAHYAARNATVKFQTDEAIAAMYELGWNVARVDRLVAMQRATAIPADLALSNLEDELRKVEARIQPLSDEARERRRRIEREEQEFAAVMRQLEPKEQEQHEIISKLPGAKAQVEAAQRELREEAFKDEAQ